MWAKNGRNDLLKKWLKLVSAARRCGFWSFVWQTNSVPCNLIESNGMETQHRHWDQNYTPLNNLLAPCMVHLLLWVWENKSLKLKICLWSRNGCILTQGKCLEARLELCTQNSSLSKTTNIEGLRMIHCCSVQKYLFSNFLCLWIRFYILLKEIKNNLL